MYIDLFIIVVVAWAVFSGWRHGFVKELFNLLGVVAGLIIAAIVYLLFHKYLGIHGSTVDDILNVVAFFILVIFLPIGLGFICGPLTRFVKRDLHMGLPNSLLGAAVSLVKFLLIVSFAFNTMAQLSILDTGRTASSHLYRPVCALLQVLTKAAVGGVEQPSGNAADTVTIEMHKTPTGKS